MAKGLGAGMKYAVIVKHAFRGMSDSRIEIVEVPRHLENVGPFEVREFIGNKLLGNFEIIAVTDRISESKWPESKGDE